MTLFRSRVFIYALILSALSVGSALLGAHLRNLHYEVKIADMRTATAKQREQEAKNQTVQMSAALDRIKTLETNKAALDEKVNTLNLSLAAAQTKYKGALHAATIKRPDPPSCDPDAGRVRVWLDAIGTD